jgi:hypothetical protein
MQALHGMDSCRVSDDRLDWFSAFKCTNRLEGTQRRDTKKLT